MNTFFENVAPVRTNPLLFGVSFSMRGRSGCEPSSPPKYRAHRANLKGHFGGVHIRIIGFSKENRWFSMVFNDFL